MKSLGSKMFPAT